MSKAKKITPITRFNANDDEVFSISLAHGDVICFSERSPSKYTANEDALGIIPVDDDTTVLVVADGMGGLPAGEKASSTMVECLITALNNCYLKTRDGILDAIEEANRQILELEMSAGTTVSIVELNHNTLRSYHVGDSLILLTTVQGDIKYRTLPHSPISYAQICGVVTEEQAMSHPERHLISNYVGCAELHIDIGPMIELARGDTLILSSDAVSDNLYEKEIGSFICKGSMLEGVNELIASCEKNMLEPLPDRFCHPDDLSLISFRRNH